MTLCVRFCDRDDALCTLSEEDALCTHLSFGNKHNLESLHQVTKLVLLQAVLSADTISFQNAPTALEARVANCAVAPVGTLALVQPAPWLLARLAISCARVAAAVVSA